MSIIVEFESNINKERKSRNLQKGDTSTKVTLRNLSFLAAKNVVTEKRQVLIVEYKAK